MGIAREAVRSLDPRDARGGEPRRADAAGAGMVGSYSFTGSEVTCAPRACQPSRRVATRKDGRAQTERPSTFAVSLSSFAAFFGLSESSVP